MSVTPEQAQAALAQAMASLNEPATMTAIAGILGVDSITFAVDDPDPDDLQLFWTATTRKGTTVHQAGTGGYTADPCHRSMRTGTRLTRAEADAIAGRVWCPRCVDPAGTVRP